MLEDFAKGVRSDVSGFSVDGIEFTRFNYYKAGQPIKGLPFYFSTHTHRGIELPECKMYGTSIRKILAVANMSGIILIIDENFFGKDIDNLKKQDDATRDIDIILLSDIYSKYLPRWDKRLKDKISSLEPVPIPKDTLVYGHYPLSEYYDVYIASLLGKKESNVINFIKPNGYEVAEALLRGIDLDSLFDDKLEKNQIYIQYAMWQSQVISQLLQNSTFVMPYEVRLYQSLCKGDLRNNYDVVEKILCSTAPYKYRKYLNTEIVTATFVTPLGNRYDIKVYRAVIINWMLTRESFPYYVGDTYHRSPMMILEECAVTKKTFRQIESECGTVTTDNIILIKSHGKVIYSHKQGDE